MAESRTHKLIYSPVALPQLPAYAECGRRRSRNGFPKIESPLIDAS